MRRALSLHPACLCPPVTAIAVEAARPAAGTLQLRYEVSGEISALKLPPAGEPLRADGLWRASCFEAFLRAGPGPGPDYCEFNLSPSRAWAAYRFTGYRDGMSPADPETPPDIAVRAEAGRFTLEATLCGLPALPWRLGLSAVIEEQTGRLSYWALAHPPGKPDFHHADCLALELPAP
jgi:hypothetical protein